MSHRSSGAPESGVNGRPWRGRRAASRAARPPCTRLASLTSSVTAPALRTACGCEPSSFAEPRRRPSASGTRPRTATANRPPARRAHPQPDPAARRLAHGHPQPPGRRRRRVERLRRRLQRRLGLIRRRRRRVEPVDDEHVCARLASPKKRLSAARRERDATAVGGERELRRHAGRRAGAVARRAARARACPLQVDQVQLLQAEQGAGRVDQPQRGQQEARALGHDRRPAPVRPTA